MLAEEKKGLYWLASYPKSGNTWFRIFLANLLYPSETPLNLNKINTGVIASSRESIDQCLGFDSADLTHDELDLLRSDIYREWARNPTSASYHKIHDAFSPIIPEEGCLGVLYFVRNPLDVAISFANHSACSIDHAIQKMADPTFAFCRGNEGQFKQVRQYLFSWSMHVQSWLNAKHLNLMILRYEDMKLDTLATFTKAVQFLNLNVTSEAIQQAIQRSDISTLQRWEEENDFSEKPAKVARFFRKGVVDDWQGTLSEAQIQQIIEQHGDVMQQFGYTTCNNSPKLSANSRARFCNESGSCNSS